PSRLRDMWERCAEAALLPAKYGQEIVSWPLFVERIAQGIAQRDELVALDPSGMGAMWAVRFKKTASSRRLGQERLCVVRQGSAIRLARQIRYAPNSSDGRLLRLYGFREAWAAAAPKPPIPNAPDGDDGEQVVALAAVELLYVQDASGKFE
ncbi:MAG: hypothetical protein ACREM8_14620, partial [Vulcanimicrobiaceae bacterium]